MPVAVMICFASSGMGRSVIFNGCWRLWVRVLVCVLEKFFSVRVLFFCLFSERC